MMPARRKLMNGSLTKYLIRMTFYITVENRSPVNVLKFKSQNSNPKFQIKTKLQNQLKAQNQNSKMVSLITN